MHKNNGRQLMQASAAAALIMAMAPTLATAETYRPECFAPASDTTSIMQIEAREAPHRIAFVNGYAGNDWRTSAIQAAKAWAERTENAERLADFTVVSVGNDSAAQITAIENFIAAGYDAITFIAVNPTAFRGVIRSAEQAGTALVAFDAVLDTESIVQVNEDQFALGAMKAQAVVDALLEAGTPLEGQILEVRGLPGNSVDRDNHEGMRSVFDQHQGLEIIEVVGNWDAGTVQRATADAIATHGEFIGIVVQEGAIGALNAMRAADHPIVPIGGDAGNGARRIIAEMGYPGLTAAQTPAMSAVALEAAVAVLEGNPMPQMVFLPIPHEKNADLVEGEHFFPELPDSYYTESGFPECFPIFTPDELLGQTADDT